MVHDDVHDTPTRSSTPDIGSPLSGRRSVISRGLLAAVAALGIGPAVASAKKKKKNKRRDPNLKLSDWLGTWNTQLSNGNDGTATFTNEFGCCDGTYSNEVGSGTFRCYPDEGGKKTDLGCRYEQKEGPAQEGSFYIDLTTKDRWLGSYEIDEAYGGGSGTWSGDRR